MQQMIKTERLVLRPYGDADASRIVACLGNLEVSRWLATVPHPFGYDDLRITTPEGKSRWPNVAAITLQGELVGAVGTGGGLGYWLMPAFWGKGIASEASVALVDFYFQNTSQDHLTAGYFIGNTASAKVLAKLGFVEVAQDTHPCAALGRDLPHVSMLLTRSNWQGG